jgi:hypothetical protein
VSTVALIVGLAGCGSSAKRLAATTTTSAPTTSTTLTGTSAATDVATSATTVPVVTTQPTVARAKDWEFDGDGRVDTARLVYLGNGEWDLVADMTTLGMQTVEFGAIQPQAQESLRTRIIGAVDPNGEGQADIFVQVDHGAANAFWTIFAVTDRQLRQVTIAGQPLRLSLYGSVMSLSGFTCQGSDLIVTGATAATDTATTYNWTRQTYRWQGAQLLLQATATGTTSIAGSSTYGRSSCGDLPTGTGS